MPDTRDLESISIESGEEPVYLALHHFPDLSTRGKKPVLLLHGASANHRSFTIPGWENGKARSLLEMLAEAGFDPWLLDWRGSSLVVDDVRNAPEAEWYNFNAGAEFDIPAAIRQIHDKRRDDEPISALGFCMGGGILAEAIALGHVHFPVIDRVVLMTLGLFYETPIDGRLKSDDRGLERLVPTKYPAVDPRVETKPDFPVRNKWPDDLEALYQDWPKRLKSHAEQKGDEVTLRNAVRRMCNRLSFMYGMPYHHSNLVPEIHDADTLLQQFGGIPLHMYIHGADNIRQGHAVHYKSPARLGHVPGEPGPPGPNPPIVSDEARTRFDQLDHVTLITGALNRLWHRDSIDLMYEWLCRCSPASWPRFTKHVLPTYGHQDLLWGRDSAKDVFPLIEQGLR